MATLLNIIGWAFLLTTWFLTSKIKNNKTQLIVRIVFSAISLIFFIAAISIQLGNYINR
jgi:hypothetical protein